MEIQLIRASLDDAETLWQMQREAFAGLLARYQDYETNPGSEPLEKVAARLAQPETFFYFILVDGVRAGAIRIVDAGMGAVKKISPLYVLPEFRGRGVAQHAIRQAEDLHGAEGWTLATILQEKGNCHLYEKMGYRATGETKPINDRMTLVFYRK